MPATTPESLLTLRNVMIVAAVVVAGWLTYTYVIV